MRLRLPTSNEGSRRFALEIAIVVIGVLIALGAQHIVTGWNDQRQADAALVAVAGNWRSTPGRSRNARCSSPALSGDWPT